MGSLSNIYPYNCDPVTVFETMDCRRRSLYYFDVMFCGSYPGYGIHEDGAGGYPPYFLGYGRGQQFSAIEIGLQSALAHLQ
jgi:hypothetical protein